MGVEGTWQHWCVRVHVGGGGGGALLDCVSMCNGVRISLYFISVVPLVGQRSTNNQSDHSVMTRSAMYMYCVLSTGSTSGEKGTASRRGDSCSVSAAEQAPAAGMPAHEAAAAATA